MADIGIVEILSVAFGGVQKMLSDKKFPQNVRALMMLVEELLAIAASLWEEQLP